MEFLSKLDLGLLTYSDGKPVDRGDVVLWYHVTPFSFRPAGGEVITIPAFDPSHYGDAELRRIRCRGVTDLTSITVGRQLLPPNGPYVIAAIPHDDGYVSKGWGGRYTRPEVDRMLLDGMVAAGVPRWKRWLIYGAVRAFGGFAWGT